MKQALLILMAVALVVRKPIICLTLVGGVVFGGLLLAQDADSFLKVGTLEKKVEGIRERVSPSCS